MPKQREVVALALGPLQLRLRAPGTPQLLQVSRTSCAAGRMRGLPAGLWLALAEVDVAEMCWYGGGGSVGLAPLPAPPPPPNLLDCCLRCLRCCNTPFEIICAHHAAPALPLGTVRLTAVPHTAAGGGAPLRATARLLHYGSWSEGQLRSWRGGAAALADAVRAACCAAVRCYGRCGPGMVGGGGGWRGRGRA